MSMKSFIMKILLTTVLAFVYSVRAHIEVSSETILVLRGSTSELFITYTKPFQDPMMELSSAEELRGDNLSFFRTVALPTVEKKLTPEENTTASNENILSEEEKEAISEANYLPTESTNISRQVTGDLPRETREEFNQTTLSVVSKEPTLVPIGETNTTNEIIIENNKQHGIKLTEHDSGAAEDEKAHERLSKDINAMALSIEDTKAIETLSQDVNALEVAAKNIIPVATSLLPEVNDIEVYNTSLESSQNNGVLAKDILNRNKRDLPLQTSSISVEADNSPEIRKFISLTVNSEYALTVSQNLLTVNDSLPVQTWRVTLYGHHPGNVILLIKLEPYDPWVSDMVVHVDVERAHWLSIASKIIGWIYFVGWGLSAHCQVYENWKRKSVVGLNFDYLGLNMIGHSLYGVYNYVLYASRDVQTEFFLRNPQSANPIQINDVVFSIHNSLVTLYTIFQCFFYERGRQKISGAAFFLFTTYGVWLFLAGLLAGLHKIWWLDFINQCALIKFTITFIKYAPQAYMNLRRNSTVGWSIGNVLLDLIGGLFSLLQMIILAYNFDDWYSLLTDTTKLGLATFTLMFDILFIIQHYILYTDHEDRFNPRDLDKEANNNGAQKRNKMVY